MILISQPTPPLSAASPSRCGSMAIAFEHRPWSTFGDADKIAPYNPLRRVPTLVLDGERGADRERDDPGLSRRPRRSQTGADRARRCAAQRRGICGSARWALGDKGVSLLYEARAAEGQAARSLGRALPVARSRACVELLEEGARRGQDAVLVRREHRPCRYRGRLRAALPVRRTLRFVRRALSALKAHSRRCGAARHSGRSCGRFASPKTDKTSPPSRRICRAQLRRPRVCRFHHDGASTGSGGSAYTRRNSSGGEQY